MGNGVDVAPAEDNPKSLGVPMQQECWFTVRTAAESSKRHQQPKTISHPQTRSFCQALFQPVKRVWLPRILFLLSLFVVSNQSRALTALQAHEWSVYLERSPLSVCFPSILWTGSDDWSLSSDAQLLTSSCSSYSVSCSQRSSIL